ncbi:9617_t:CDS:2, partial [Racocetra fulgida]
GQHVTITHNYKDNRTVRDSSPSVLQSFSFTENEQGAVIEPFVNLVEKAIYEFLVKNESTIPLEVVENFCSKQRPPVNTDFSNADLLCMLNFMIENIKIFLKNAVFHGQFKANPVELLTNFKKNVRNKVAHGIVVDEKGGNYEEALAKKENVDSEIIKRWIDIASQKRKPDAVFGNKENVDSQKRKLDKVLDDKENIDAPQKRIFKDKENVTPLQQENIDVIGNVNFGKMIGLILDIFEDLEETEKDDRKKILKLAFDENVYMSKLLETIKNEERKVQVRKFIQFASVMFDV